MAHLRRPLVCLLLKNMKARKSLEKAELYNHPNLEEKRAKAERALRARTLAFHVLIFTPIIVYWLTIIASLERTPLTGR